MSGNSNFNRFSMALLSAGLIALISGKVVDFLYNGGPEHPGHEEKEARGYKIDVVETANAAEGAAPAGAGDLSALYATADVAAGEKFVQAKCTVCHDVSKGGTNKVGPHIWGVFNRTVASVGDFSYSSGMKAHGGKWDFEALNKFLWSPAKTVPGTMMSFAGIGKDQDRANVIAYLATKMTDSPAALPKGAPAAPAKK